MAGDDRPTKRCDGCAREFHPSSRHRLCPACRRQGAKVACACGAPMQRESTTCTSCVPAQVGSSSPNWRGGRTYHKAGYVMVWVPDHPRADPKHPYVFEHILRIEASIGRHLVDGENVHHRNGVRDDNRLENLELWVRPHPAGIRVADAVAWAREILARYGEDSRGGDRDELR